MTAPERSAMRRAALQSRSTSTFSVKQNGIFDTCLIDRFEANTRTSAVVELRRAGTAANTAGQPPTAEMITDGPTQRVSAIALNRCAIVR